MGDKLGEGEERRRMAESCQERAGGMVKEAHTCERAQPRPPEPEARRPVSDVVTCGVTRLCGRVGLGRLSSRLRPAGSRGRPPRAASRRLDPDMSTLHRYGRHEMTALGQSRSRASEKHG